ncbi:MAG: ABC transporter permease subunit, partial [Candidatus Saccharimonadales bacterium]
ILGLFLGVPLIAKEYQDDTVELAWTQTITRRKWLRAKLAWALSAAAVSGAIITVLITWWSQTENAIGFSRFAPPNFDVQGLMPVVYAVLAVALGAAIGAWFKKVLLAMAVTLFAFVAFQVVIASFVRPHYEAPLKQTQTFNMFHSAQNGVSVSLGLPNSGHGTWMFRQQFIQPEITTTPQKINSTCRALPVNTTNPKCVATNITTYQPANHYWPFQFIEAAIYLALTAIAVAATYLFVLKRDA